MEKGYLFISNSRPVPIEERLGEKVIPIDSFSAPAIYAASKLGFKIFRGINHEQPDLVTCIDYDITYYNQNTFRNPLAIGEIRKAYKNLCQLLKNHPEIEVIHCNTPIGGVIGRICGHKFHKKVIYTAHGFHFWKGAPLKNWVIYYTIEKLMARWTDTLITINNEDYSIGQKLMNHRNQRCYLVPGVGIDLNVYQRQSNIRDKIRKDLNLKDADIMCISMGDLIERKNYSVTIKAIKESKLINLHYYICGDGPQKEELENLVKSLKLENQVHFLGRRNDIKDLLQGADLFLFSSKQEGLARSLMEAMAMGLPCVASNIRGNVDLIHNGEGGFLCSPSDVHGFAEAIRKISLHPNLMKNMAMTNMKKIKEFSLEASKEAFLDIFKKELS